MVTRENYSIKTSVMPTLSLFSSLGTIVCCALPALLVSLGAGATLASIIAAAPWLVALSKYKVWTFGISALLLGVAGFVHYRNRNAPCPVEPQQARACQRLRVVNAWVLGVAALIWCVGFFFAFLAVYVFY